jgi:DNA polymerase-3 subunit alpha
VLEDLPLDDAPSYALLGRGDTLGVFQLDGGPMRALLRLMRPDNFEDISAVLALYRPGPMGADSHTNYALRKNGRQGVTPIHPELAEPLAEILDDSRADRLSGAGDGDRPEGRRFTPEPGGSIRRAMGKKKKRSSTRSSCRSPTHARRAAALSSDKALWDTWSRSRICLQQAPPPRQDGLVLDRVPEPAEFMAALPLGGDGKVR